MFIKEMDPVTGVWMARRRRLYPNTYCSFLYKKIKIRISEQPQQEVERTSSHFPKSPHLGNIVLLRN